MGDVPPITSAELGRDLDDIPNGLAASIDELAEKIAGELYLFVHLRERSFTSRAYRRDEHEVLETKFGHDDRSCCPDLYRTIDPGISLWNGGSA